MKQYIRAALELASRRSFLGANLLALIRLIAPVDSSNAIFGRAQAGEWKEKRPWGRFTISKATTYVTGPLDKDGYIDYVTALNTRLREGITPANNANVLLWKVFGPHPEGASMPTEFFNWLGIAALPEEGAYFINEWKFITETLKIPPGQEVNDLTQKFYRVGERPWIATDCQEMAAWLDANDTPLVEVVELTKQTHYYLPLVPSKRPGEPFWLYGVPLPSVQKSRQLASVLCYRAMLRIGQGKDEQAWDDLLACHRLGRLIAHGGTCIELLVGIAIEAIACRGDLVFLDRTLPDWKGIDRCLRDLQGLGPFPRLAEKVGLLERFAFLDMLLMVDRFGIAPLDALGGPLVPAMLPPDRFLIGIDWDPALESANRWYDRMFAALMEENRTMRCKKLKSIELEAKRLADEANDPKSVLRTGSRRSAKERGKALGDVLMAQAVPRLLKLQTAWDRTKQTLENVKVAFSLARFERDHKRFPKELADLVPGYLQQVPQDYFSGKPLIYRPTNSGYLLYSVGVNGKDDGGRTYEDTPPGDDLVARMPVPERKAN